MNIIEALNDKNLFKNYLTNLTTWGSWQVYLKALFGLPMSKEEIKIYKHCTGNKKPPESPSKTSYVLSGRRSGKSTISALISVYLAVSRDWSKVLSPGEMGFVFLIAESRDQAMILKRYVSGIINSAPGLRSLVKRELAWEIELNNSITIAVRTKNFRTLRGFTVVGAVLEELAFWRSEESANPDVEVLTAIKPAMLTVKDSMLIGISSVYAKRGLLYDQYKRYFGKSKGPLVWKSTTLDMNPIVDKSEIEAGLKTDPAKYKAEYLSEFRGDIENYLGIEDIEKIIEAGINQRGYNSAFNYMAHCDPSGGRVDSMTLGISHPEGDKVVLDRIIERKPPFSPEEVVRDFADLLRQYRVSTIKSDRYAGAWVEEAFRRHNIMVKYSELSASQIYEAFIPIVMNEKAILLDNSRLKMQLSNLERKTRAGGKDVIDHPSGSHDDMAVACAGALLSAQGEARPSDLELALRLPHKAGQSVAHFLRLQKEVGEQRKQAKIVEKRKKEQTRKLSKSQQDRIAREEAFHEKWKNSTNNEAMLRDWMEQECGPLGRFID